MKLKNIYDKQDWERSQSQRALFVIDVIGNIEPKNVTDKHIDKLKSKLLERGLSGSTINRYLASLSKLLKYAHKRYSIYEMERIPHIEWLKENKSRIRYVTQEEEKNIIKAMKDMKLDDYLNFYLFLMDTGLRLGEALQFTKQDITVDSKNNYYVTIHGDISKNGQTRAIPLTARAKSIVNNVNFKDNTPVFSHIDYWKAEKHWRKLRNVLGLDGDKQFVIHCLRHTCATRLAQSGKIELHLIKEMLGHKNFAMTLRYSHFKPNNLLGAVDVLNRLNE